MNLKSKKARTIAAIVTLMHQWEEGTHNQLKCPLCKIHFCISRCYGCPNESKYEHLFYGCYRQGFDISLSKDPNRAQWWLTLLPYLLSVPEKQYTKKGWKPFGLVKKFKEITGGAA